VDDVAEPQLVKEFENMAAGIASAVASAPTHEEFIRANCPAVGPARTAANA
jgi:hypothetical protein